MDDPQQGQVYALVIGNKQPTTRLVTANIAMDGGMVEFQDAVTGNPCGSAGIHWWRYPGHVMEIPPELVPTLPDEEKWTYAPDA